MPWFTQIVENNKVNQIIYAVEGIDENKMSQLYGGIWVETFESGSNRKNFAGVNFTYDAQRDAFIPPQPFPSWILNEDTCTWQSPIPVPEDGGSYIWNESDQLWEHR